MKKVDQFSVKWIDTMFYQHFHCNDSKRGETTLEFTVYNYRIQTIQKNNSIVFCVSAVSAIRDAISISVVFKNEELHLFQRKKQNNQVS